MSAEKEEEFPEESLPSDYADALKKDKKEGEEELKELSSDYKVGYDQYLKEKDNPKKEDDEKDELIRDYRSGLDLGNKESVPSTSKRKVIIKEEPIETEEKKEVEPKQEVIKEEVKATPEEVKEEKPENKEEAVEEKPVEQSGKEVKEKLEEVLNTPEKTETKEEPKDKEKEKNPTEVEVEKLAEKLFNLNKRKNELFAKMDTQRGLMYKLGIKKKDSQINEEYRTVYGEYEEVLGKISSLTGYSVKEIEEHYFSGRENEEKQEKSPETEKKAEGLKDYLYKKAKEVNEQINNLEGGKKGSFEKIKALMKDRKFQFVVGLAIVGVAIAAPPTGFISMITFGMHAGFLPAAYATKATALAGMAGGAFIMRGFSGFVNDLKKEGKDEIDLTNEIK
ncbi:MAG: hypothetical protein WC511_06320 [Candidatus Pacearchaeota archaeon]|jgi:hypothetical protein